MVPILDLKAFCTVHGDTVMPYLEISFENMTALQRPCQHSVLNACASRLRIPQRKAQLYLPAYIFFNANLYGCLKLHLSIKTQSFAGLGNQDRNLGGGRNFPTVRHKLCTQSCSQCRRCIGDCQRQFSHLALYLGCQLFLRMFILAVEHDVGFWTLHRKSRLPKW